MTKYLPIVLLLLCSLKEEGYQFFEHLGPFQVGVWVAASHSHPDQPRVVLLCFFERIHASHILLNQNGNVN